ncbi:MAG TPA: NAD-dependent epimerase/dehydratase family protein [Streptosporangiaceae bacterium]|jgi:UDP-glucose 4-epimerase
MRVAVTGGSGFIGSHVVDHLVGAGHDVVVIDVGGRWRNPAAEYRAADLFDEAALAAAADGAQAIFHLAGAADVNEVAADPARAVRLNVEGTARVLDAARRGGVDRVLLASTVWVYGATVGEGERTEASPVDLARSGHVYVATKLAAEMLVHSYREMYGQHYTILRYGIPYGPRMRDALVVARFVQAARAGQRITIAGTGEQQRNYVYVEDIADAHVRALVPAAADQTLALEGGEPVSVREIADAVCRMVQPVPVEHVPARAADYAGVAISGNLAKELLDWAPVTPFEAGVRRYLDWLGSAEAAGGATAGDVPPGDPAAGPSSGAQLTAGPVTAGAPETMEAGARKPSLEGA